MNIAVTSRHASSWHAVMLGVILAFIPFSARSEQSQPLTALDKIAIMELAARFEISLDREDVDGYLATFRGDGVLEGFGAPARGTEALRSAFWNMLNVFARNRRHCSMNQVITGDSQRATMISYLIVFNRNDLGRGGSALVSDTAVKENGVWLLSSRRIEVDKSFISGNAAAQEGKK